MDFATSFKTAPVIFTEGAVVERLRREFGVKLNDFLVHSGLLYDPEGRAVLRKIYKQYLDIGQSSQAPMILFTPTRRANPEQIKKAGLSNKAVNADNVRLLQGVRNECGEYAKEVFIGGLMGCQGDAYRAEEALTTDEAAEFHQQQAKALSGAGVDFLCGTTLPALSEALGLALAMAETGKPYVLSFVIRDNGTLLDGNSLHKAILTVDQSVSPKPLFYMVNCVHPSIVLKALENTENCTELVRQRLTGIQANTSAKSPEELDGSSELVSEDSRTLVNQLVTLHDHYHFKVLGGCCGTDHRHIEMLVRAVGVNRVS
ncbi:homocysteine S-methyltransferase family protein [Desulforamulus aeronauticus]|uniref:Homocysteine S-methyltransferase n=1 Tax=Desulforamulus aeronauticus DSM 10349 TaxID=1121421 RepID=A0A1M6QB98_9FIRM|nr:homocysteine S-methyltransferase family protein [Desulforamulus aeronauticus]SHK17367.1 homocysteine S-methyltransferase [Desulforamulus aeronauticus DSM 10349]